MYHSGIGGGGFALVRGPDGEYEAVDFRETAPAAASQDMYKNRKQKSISGGLSVGVPSEVYGLEYLHKKYGVGALIKRIYNSTLILYRHFLGRRLFKVPSKLPAMVL